MSTLQKMYMVGSDEMNAIRGKKDKELQMMKYNEAFRKNANVEKIKEENEWKKLSERLKPLFDNSSSSTTTTTTAQYVA